MGTTLSRMADTAHQQLPRTMRVAELTGNRTLRLGERPVPGVPGGWTVVRVAAAGVCGTELHFLEGLLDPRGETRVLGHEVAGTVCGPGVRGQRAAIYNVLNCRTCRYCRSDRDRLCERSQGMIGFTVDGGFAEYVVVPEANLVPLPETVTFEAGAVLACSGMTAVHAIRLAGIGIAEPVVVNGIGGVGLMLTQIAALAGATVLAVADDPAKLDLAESLGARAGLLIEKPEGYETLPQDARRLLGQAPDVFFETVGTRETMRAGFGCLAPRGRFRPDRIHQPTPGHTSGRTDQERAPHPHFSCRLQERPGNSYHAGITRSTEGRHREPHQPGRTRRRDPQSARSPRSRQERDRIRIRIAADHIVGVLKQRVGRAARDASSGCGLRSCRPRRVSARENRRDPQP